MLSIPVLRIYIQALVAACLPLHLIYSPWSLHESLSAIQASLFPHIRKLGCTKGTVPSEEPSWDMQHSSDRLSKSHVYWGGRDASAEVLKHHLVLYKSIPRYLEHRNPSVRTDEGLPCDAKSVAEKKSQFSEASWPVEYETTYYFCV